MNRLLVAAVLPTLLALVVTAFAALEQTEDWPRRAADIERYFIERHIVQ